mgnify:CR=1 FL=1
MHKNVSTVRIILSSALKNAVLSIGTVAAVAGAIVTALIPPLVLERIVNTLTEGKRPGIMLVSLGAERWIIGLPWSLGISILVLKMLLES